MTPLKNVEAQMLGTVLQKRFAHATKHKVGDLELGSIVIVKHVEINPPEEVYAILVTYRKNKKDTCLASLEGFDNLDTGYKLKNSEEVAHLVTFGDDID
jgi:hypothetical protein